MAITADAWVDQNGRATIAIWSSEGWTNGNWNLTGSAGEFPSSSYVSLYGMWTQSGVGVIDGNYLTVTIPSCPDGYFTLNTQRGAKRFILSEGKITFGSALIGSNSFPAYPYEASGIITYKKALIFFGGDIRPFRGRVTAQLQVDGVLHATIGGNAVDSVSDGNTGMGAWAIPACAFFEFYWHIVPEAPTVYDFIFTEQKRGQSTGSHRFQVEMDLLKIYSPLSTPAFNVQPSNRFSIALAPSVRVF